jgi:hypothetical protein
MRILQKFFFFQKQKQNFSEINTNALCIDIVEASMMYFVKENLMAYFTFQIFIEL